MPVIDDAVRELIAEEMRPLWDELGRLRALLDDRPGAPSRERPGHLPPSLADEVWLTTRQAAEYTGRHPVTVRKAAAGGTLQSTQAGAGRGRRYQQEWLDAWLTDGDQRRRA